MEALEYQAFSSLTPTDGVKVPFFKERLPINVVKRSGTIVPFRAERIFNAIAAAFREVHTISPTQTLPAEIHAAVYAVTVRVIGIIREYSSISVEEIQDIVERELMAASYYDIAKGYIVYRDKQKLEREGSVARLKVRRRDGKTTARFNPIKIASAIERAFIASLKLTGETPLEIIQQVNLLTNLVVNGARRDAIDEVIDLEEIQDLIERELMEGKFFQVAKDFILYRAKRTSLRESAASVEEVKVLTTDNLQDTLKTRIAFACKGLTLPENSIEEIYRIATSSAYEGITPQERDLSLVLAARVNLERDPNFGFVAARLLLDIIYRESIGVNAHDAKLEEIHQAQFPVQIAFGIKHKRLSPRLAEYDLPRLAAAIKLDNDLKFQYLGLQTLYDRYLLHQDERRFETPQYFWMRVAMGLGLSEPNDREAKVIEFYNVLSTFKFVSSTPTLFNSGTLHSQMSSCYLSTVMDDLQHIFKCVSDDAQLSKWAGGLGNDWSNIRATGAWISGTNGRSQGVIPFLKVANDTAVAVNQGGKRKGAMCAYLETWHLDIEDFLELRKNTGDERRRTHDMNTANWIPDLFMKRVVENGEWTLFSPNDVPDLHDLYGKAFERRYAEYEELARNGKLPLHKRIEAQSLWRKMLSMLFETGHPWITFKDPSNIRSPQDHVGVVHSSNLCTEILLNTSQDEIAVCNLGSVNLREHTTKDGIQIKELEETIRVGIRMLDNVIDLNFYPVPESENANMRHRPIGLGLMGFQDALYTLEIPYNSSKAVEFADRSMELISYYAILSSSELAKERGAYPSYQGSKWDRGLLPIDTLTLLEKERGEKWVTLDKSVALDWSVVRESIKKYGMRNSNTMAIAPTATLSNITGVTQSIEPTFKHLYAKSNLSGEFLIHNDYLVAKLQSLNLWDEAMIDDLKYFDGSLTEIERIPEEVKELFKCAFEIESEWLIECASRRQKWIDMGQSLNLYIAEASGRRLNDMYLYAWKLGLKTTYYLRSKSATQIEKSTSDINKRGLQPRWMKSKSASANIEVARKEEEVTVCNLNDPECESCQ
jgi:ribonucleoside-diphosphate reductase alpha chain